MVSHYNNRILQWLALGDHHQIHYKNLCIWNPSTIFLRMIPGSPSFPIWLGSSLEEYRFFENYGFGHVCATDDYKLVLVLSSNAGPVEIHVFSLRHNFWKVKALSMPRMFARLGTLSNRALHWISRPTIETPSSIYAFDLAEEEFWQVSLPNKAEYGMTPDEFKLLVLSNGCLCVWHVLDGHYKFWAMTEYAVTKPWVKLFQFSVDDLPDVFTSYRHPQPFFITECGTVYINLGNKEIVKIECRKEERSLCSGRYSHGSWLQFRGAVNDETLVSVPL